MNWELPRNGIDLTAVLVAEFTPDLPTTSHAGISLFQVVFVPICGLLALRSFVRMWGGSSSRLVGFFGTCVWAAAAIAITMPAFTSVIAQRMGINRGADLVMYLSILGGLAAVFYFYQWNRKTENLITELVRREAIRGAKFGPTDENH